MQTQQAPVCLTIAGSDSSGGAGIQADLKTFSFFNTFGASVVTAITAQNPLEVTAIYPLTISAILSQYRAVANKLKISAIKTGMLFSVEAVENLVAELRLVPDETPIIVDPVMVATSGSKLNKENLTVAFKGLLAPLSTLITPNIPEAEALIGTKLKSRDQLASAAKHLSQECQTKVLLKGGHQVSNFVTDFFSDGSTTYELKASYVVAITTHGTGCMLSSAIAANMALGKNLLDAMMTAKAFIVYALKSCIYIGDNICAIGLPKKLDNGVVTVEEV